MTKNSQKRKKQIAKNLTLTFILIATLLIAVLALLWNSDNGDPLSPPDNGSQNQTPLPPTETTPTVNSIFTRPVSISEINDTGYLSLVNHDFAVNQQLFNEQSMVSAWPTVAVSTTTVTVHQSALNAASDMFDAAREDGINGLFITSGFRCTDSQASIFANGDPNYVMPPGHSEHHTGLALDILVLGYTMQQFGATDGARWLADNAWRFGFILRYPENAQHITGIAFEPWHFRYVGQLHAWYMQANNLVLEEYLEFLQQAEEFTVTFDGIEYHILHQQPQEGKINLPQEKNYVISSDNMGGFIVIAWS